MKTDEELMLNYCAGESSGFSELYRRYKKRVYGFLNEKVMAQERDDVFQKIFLKLHDKRHLYNAEYAFAPWFFTICRHVIIDHYRAQKKSHEEIDLEQMVAETSGDEADFPELPSMSEDQYRLLYLKFVEGRGYKELEREFNSSASSLRKRVSRLLSTFRAGE